MYLEDDFKKIVIFILSHVRNIRVPFYICVLWKCFVKLGFVFFFFSFECYKSNILPVNFHFRPSLNV